MLAGHMSILVTTTNTGTFRAKARPRCSLVIPTIPALLPTWKGREKWILFLHLHEKEKKKKTIFGTSWILYIDHLPSPSPFLTISMQKSGRCPVIPNTVVLRYFSWPARSMKVMTLEDFSQILVQSRLPPWLSGLFTTWEASTITEILCKHTVFHLTSTFSVDPPYYY